MNETARHSTFAGAVSCEVCRESCDHDFPCRCCYELQLVMLGAPPDGRVA